MSLISFVSKRAVILLSLLCAFACVASANTVYDVSGTFGTTVPPISTLNGGTFSGTFTATLPVTGGTETITTFDIDLINSSDAILANLTSSSSGDTGAVYVFTSNCAIASSTTGPCDAFFFSNASSSDYLELNTPLSFTGGAIYPDYPIGGAYGSSGGEDNSNIAVVSGSIDPASEPGTFLLLGLVALTGLWIERKRLFA